MSEHDQPNDLDGRPAPPARAVPEFAPPPPPEEREPEYVELDFAEEPESRGGLVSKFGLKRRERPPAVELPPRAHDPFSDSPPEKPVLPQEAELEATAAPADRDDAADMDDTAEDTAAPLPVSEFSMRRVPSEEENVLAGDIEPTEADLPEPEPDPFADSESTDVEPLRPAPPEIIDATATVDERTGQAWERQVAPPEAVDASAPVRQEKKAKKEKRTKQAKPAKTAGKGSLLGKFGIKKIEPASEVEEAGAMAFCPLHDVPLSSPLIFNENTGARYPAGTTHAVCIGVLPAPPPVADEPLSPVPSGKMQRPKRAKKEKAPKPAKPAKPPKPDKAKRPSWQERRAAAKEQKRAEGQDELLGALDAGEQKLSRRERRQQEKRRRQLDASERKAQKALAEEAHAEEARSEEARQAALAPEALEPVVGLPMAPASPASEAALDVWQAPAESPIEGEPKKEKKEKKAKRARQPKAAKPAKPAKESKEKKAKRSLLGLLGIRKIEKESKETALTPWESPRFTPPLVEPVAAEPPQRSFPPLVIDAEEEEPPSPPLPHLRRPHLPPVEPLEPEPRSGSEPGESLVFNASRPDEEIARAQEKSQRRRGWRSRRERQPKADKVDKVAPVMAGSEWRQRVLAREARPFLLLLLTAFLLLIAMWVLAVRSSADSEVASQTQATTAQPGSPADAPAAGEAEVPDVVGQTLEAARLVLDASSFEVSVKQAQSDRPEGEIVSQDPAPGTTVPVASTIAVTVSGGQGQVPNVVGQPVDVAAGRIEGAGFEVERRARVDRGHVGEVVEQQPKAGASAGKGSVVVVFFGRAPAATPLPNVVGQTQSEARAALAEKGHSVRIRYAYGDEPTGEVVKSSPAAGQKLADGDVVTLTVSLGPRTTATTPTPAASRNGNVAYVTVSAGKGEIYLAKPDGTNRQNLSNNPADDRNPTFAPTGLQLAFQSDRAGNFDIYSRPTSGQGLRRLTTASNDEREPAWSPLGQRIAYVSKEGDFYALYTMAADGTGKTKVLGGQRSWRTPSWSPDGQRLIVAGGNADDYNIFVVSASGGTPRQVAGGDSYDVDPVFSPNGLRVLFSSNRDGDYDLYSVALAGGAATRMTAAAGDDMNPSYSPDGKRIVFQSTRAGAAAVYHMPADGGSVQRVASGTAPAWQPS